MPAALDKVSAPGTMSTISATRAKIKRVGADFIGCAQPSGQIKD
jgi:hypothetical protein